MFGVIFVSGIIEKHMKNYMDYEKHGDLKRLLSYLIANLGVSYAIYDTNLWDNKLAKIISGISFGLVGKEAILLISDKIKKENSKKKLLELFDKLKDKNINIDEEYLKKTELSFSNYDMDKNSFISWLYLDDCFIKSVNDDVITLYVYKDDEVYDITDEVKESMLSKRKYNKYLKNKNNK